MMETEIGNRGSKIVFNLGHNSNDIGFTVKEQRVDDSKLGFKLSAKPNLRCTLMGFERNHQIKILSNQLKNFSSLFIARSDINGEPKPETLDTVLNPWFITGFTDAEGCFQLSIRHDKKYKSKALGAEEYLLLFK